MIMNKLVVMGVLLVVLSSFMVVADSCSGFFGTIKCVLWGDPVVRSSLAGEAVQRNLVGGVCVIDGKTITRPDFCSISGAKIGDDCTTENCKNQGGGWVWAWNDKSDNIEPKPKSGWTVITIGDKQHTVRRLVGSDTSQYNVDNKGKVYDYKGTPVTGDDLAKVQKTREYVQAQPLPIDVPAGAKLSFFKGNIPYYVKDGKVYTKSDPKQVDNEGFGEEKRLVLVKGKPVPVSGQDWIDNDDPVKGLIEIPGGTAKVVVFKDGTKVYLKDDGTEAGRSDTANNEVVSDAQKKSAKAYNSDGAKSAYKPPVAGSSGSSSSTSSGGGKGGKSGKADAPAADVKKDELVEYGNCIGEKSCFVDRKTGTVHESSDKKDKILGLIFDSKGNEGKGSFRPDKGYIFANDGDGKFAVQKIQKERQVEYIDNNGDVLQLKDEKGKTQKWDQSGNKWVDYPDASSSSLKKFVETKLKAGDTGFEDNNKVVKEVKSDYAKGVLGDQVYEDYKSQLDVDGISLERENKEFQLSGGQGSIKSDKKDSNGFSTVTVTVELDDKEGKSDSKASKDILVKDGQIMAEQTVEGKEKGELMLYNGGSKTSAYTLKDNKKGLADFKNGEELVITDGAKENPQEIAGVQLKEDIYTFTDFKEKTQTVRDTKTGELRVWESGDYYKDSKTTDGGCKGKPNCFIPSKGKIYDKNKNLIYLADVDTKGTFSDQKLEKIELFDPQTGRYKGVELPSGDRYIQDGEKITGTDKDGKNFIYTRDEKGVWKKDSVVVDQSGTKVLNDVYQSASVRNTQNTLESIYAIENSIKSYPALNKLIFKDIGGAVWSEEWQQKADETFAPMLGSNWFPSAICETESRMKDVVPQGKAMIKTSSGTYQTVASVQGERSEKKAPILCSRNPDKEAKEEFVCGDGAVCVEQLCYADKVPEGGDGEADVPAKGEIKPLEGFFYTISWAVTAPSDEKLTPLMKSGAAVSFNVVVKDTEGKTVAHLYRGKQGEKEGAIELANGASDRDVMTHYSEKELSMVCIVWKNAPLSQDFGANAVVAGIGSAATLGGAAVAGGVAAGTGDYKGFRTDAYFFIQPVPTICSPIPVSNKGKVTWESSSKTETTSSTTVTSGKVEKVRNW